MRHAPRVVLAGVLGFAASFLAACGGGGGLLSANQARSLNGALDQVSAAVNARDCGAARSASAAFSNAVANLPSSVSQALRDNLQQGASTVGQLAASGCATTTGTTVTTQTVSTRTHTTTTSTTTTPTTPTTTTPTTPTTTTSATTPTGTGTSTTGTTGGVGLGGSVTTGSSGGGSAGNGNGNGN